MSQEFVLHITDGPSKLAMMFSLFEDAAHQPRLVTFSGTDFPGNPADMIVTIDSVEREDSSGESWNITCRESARRYRGYYSTRTRSGYLYPFTDQ